MNRYDDWKLHTPDNELEKLGECLECTKDIYEGDCVTVVLDGLLHTDCFKDYAEEMLVIDRFDCVEKEDLK